MRAVAESDLIFDRKVKKMGNNIVDSSESLYYDTNYDAFEQYCNAFDVKDKDIIAVLVAYFDESYNQRSINNLADPLVYTVGCCLSTKEQWLKYRVRWQSALKQAKIKHFHMTDFEAGKGDYASWSKLVAIERLKRFHSIMNDHIMFNCASVVNCADFDTFTSKKVKRRKKQPKLDYYSFDVIVCMDAIGNWCTKNNYNEPINYVFAHLDKQGSFLDEWFAYCSSNPVLKKRYRLSSVWAKGLMRDVPELQAPDIVAYEMNKRAANEYGRAEKFTRKSLANLNFDYDKIEPLYYSMDEIKSIFSSGDISPFTLE